MSTAGDRESDRKGLATRPGGWGYLVWYALVALVLLSLWHDAFRQVAVRTIDYSEFKAHLANGAVSECTVGEDEIDGRIVAKSTVKPSATSPGHHEPDAVTPTSSSFLFRTVRVEDPKLIDQLQAARIRYTGVRPGFSQVFWAWLLPIGAMVVLWLALSRRIGAAGETVLGFGKSRAKLLVEQESQVTFSDVAGCDEAKIELSEIVDFLRHPEHYRTLGAKIPKGVLLLGPPGTGKTLLARAVAGEAKVPFFLISGSDFVEMFVGVGAARVRDLFLQAKAKAPCIIFMDELDAIGRQRGVHVGAVNDEREQTLNQLLVEMDGFEANSGIMLLAATNRPDVLDRALLRPGRFDRQIVIDLPDRDGREAILKIHTRDKPLARDVDLDQVARATPGFSGADLANAMNEAALLAARRKATQIVQADLEEAVEKVVAGPERKSRRLHEEEKRRVAYHEVGHALVAAYCAHADPVRKISIIPRGRGALGYTLQLPADDQFLLSRSELVDRLKGMMGGRAAEELVFGEPTTGAENDLERATAIARQMTCLYGMSELIGLVHCGQRPNPLLPDLAGEPLQRDCSEPTAREIDEEVKRLLAEAYESAREILGAHREQLELVASELLRCETLDGLTFLTLIGKAKAVQSREPSVSGAAGSSPGAVARNHGS